MGVVQSPTPPHLYPQALQLKLYQAFIFSIPILFSIILFLLFYLFYLKRRASNNIINSNNIPSRPIRSHQTTTTYISSPCHRLDLKVELKDDLPIILFDEELRKKDSLCCVCLGEYIMKEELLQVPSCKHVFHIDCIHLWLHTNTTCPLCRSSIFPNPKHKNPNPIAPTTSSTVSPPPPPPQLAPDRSSSATPPPQVIQVSLEVQQQQELTTISNSAIVDQESTIPRINNSNSNSNNMERYFDSGSVVIFIQTHVN
ncbi:hypothetical protein G4B88_006478 [Cannabis sativa]|uniref:RING-type E3 ubiquitin transferase n=1 Tax=Cannabis sativa TaxID=3483 RepID=A0A7J6H4N7_CANSA|nr:hypothetical protein G4B88_006478 [Cannabis sativa]